MNSRTASAKSAGQTGAKRGNREEKKKGKARSARKLTTKDGPTREEGRKSLSELKKAEAEEIWEPLLAAKIASDPLRAGKRANDGAEHEILISGISARQNESPSFFSVKLIAGEREIFERVLENRGFRSEWFTILSYSWRSRKGRSGIEAFPGPFNVRYGSSLGIFDVSDDARKTKIEHSREMEEFIFSADNFFRNCHGPWLEKRFTAIERPDQPAWIEFDESWKVREDPEELFRQRRLAATGLFLLLEALKFQGPAKPKVPFEVKFATPYRLQNVSLLRALFAVPEKRRKKRS